VQSYFEIDIDIHTWGTTPLSGLNTIKGKFPDMLLRGGVVIEGDTDEELPEQMLCSAYLSGINPARAGRFEPALTEYLGDPANHVAALPVG
jgi:hypothetical protein